MGIYKVADKTGKYPKALKELLKYAFGHGDEKTHIENVIILGEYNKETIDANSVFDQYQETKKLWGKTTGRAYFHYIHSFHKDENITEKQAAEITAELCKKIYPGFQVTIVPHHDKERIDVHVIGNSVSCVNGKKLHTKKADLERYKKTCNEICQKHGLSVPEKGKNFYGEDLHPDTVIAWKKDTFQALSKAKPTEKAAETKIDMFQLVLLIIQALLNARSVQDFIVYMQRNSWKVTWQENRKNVTFESEKTGRKFRASNIDKTYGAKLRYVFGEDFVLDKEHMERMCKTLLEHKQGLYGSRADMITNEKHLDLSSFNQNPKVPTKTPEKKTTTKKYPWENPNKNTNPDR